MTTTSRILTLLLSVLITSCAQWMWDTQTLATRLPASDVEEISYYLSVDKFKYYINEYSVAQEGKVPDPIISYLRSITIKDILEMGLETDDLSQSSKYDEIIYKLLKEKNLTAGTTKENLKWNYNFFKNKLDEAFALSGSKLDINLSLPGQSSDLDRGTPIVPQILDAEEMTLDSGHYISNRTTRAIFWEAIENNRPIEFHLGDSREFLKELKDKRGEILFEVKPLAKNYNKIYIIQYPGEKTYRYAITNIGGQDRLDHLTHQISLSNFDNKKLKTKILVKGDIKKFHEAKAQEHAMQLRLLPKADRVIIGQKESIDGKFSLFWKVKALKNLYDEDKSAFDDLSTKDREKLMTVMKSPFETLFKEKKIIEDTYASLEDTFTKNPDLIPGKFKLYNYDNFTIEMCDYVFETEDKKTIRWRVVSNVWGDEVIPIAQALKNTGHVNVSYMGTAGAFATKGYKVGDLVIPAAVRDGNKLLPLSQKGMQIEGAKQGGSVEHVGSPFEETEDWLKKAQAQSDFVEVETSYLRRIFNGPQDKLEIYLLISDILGSETETLAHATSAKRKNAQNKLLAKLFERDSGKGIPFPKTEIATDAQEKMKNLVFKILEKKSVAYRYFIYSSLKGKSKLTANEIEKFSSTKAAFSDAFILERLVKIGELIHDIKKSVPEAGEFDVAFSKSLVLGTWHPKEEKLNVLLKAKNANTEKALQKALEKNSAYLNSLKAFANVSASQSGGDSSMIWMKTPEKIDPDFLVKIYSLSGFKSAGLIKNVTYNGNITLDFLPTARTENPLEAFYQGSAPAVTGTSENSCLEAMRMFMQMI